MLRDLLFIEFDAESGQGVGAHGAGFRVDLETFLHHIVAPRHVGVDALADDIGRCGKAQLDGGGVPEIVALGERGVTVLRSGDGRRWANGGRIVETDHMVNLTTGDVDGDGRDEIALVGFRGVQVLWLAQPDQ